ncbi:MULTISPECIES: GNAT family N-acetyltransferase [unclassified Clostridium]|uniref:GNAT family N-acetyltransferase n=1 Tax=unclassified Clostridium TaxID=2614128 RepID=UPI000297B849|nr:MULTISPECIES: GNAT family N-acetyltransferase [unclassified Clostridium]EKQ51647.1 MAG: acetyltransferase, N-acetylglutamate synthase [Clostridium sp. Maddingley MBC34-26]
MCNITYKYIDYKSKEFNQVIDLRFNVLFKPYGKIAKYNYDELDDVSFHLIALSNYKVIGYSRMTNVNGKGKITNVVVDPEYIKRGIGLEMLKRHIIEAEINDINYLYLNARLDTVNFYNKVGFECKGSAFLSEKSGLMLQEMYYTL